MATYIHKHGPDNGTISLQEYEVGISDAAYMYSNLTGTIQKLRCGYADNAGQVGGLNPGDIFMKTGQDQVVSDTNVTFNDKVTATTFVGDLTGTATKAKYADLAENYEADSDYETGTVLFYGYNTEVSIDGEIFAGVTSDKPGYLMNSDADFEYTACIALKGRIPVKITGEANRGDVIIVDRDNKGFGKIGDVSDINTKDFIGICINGTIDGFAEIKV